MRVGPTGSHASMRLPEVSDEAEKAPFVSSDRGWRLS